ncbi:MAG TPA: SDR family NAD(P)-dependent oxidoreductase, partial [Anaerolineae bacterium]|nr:SDR family NAD(P)-dependent oxidoreductase [Anaerolineae bacterium]
MNIHPHNLFDFADKTALVTGSGSGLGTGIAVRFAQAGAAVVVNYRSSARGARAVVAQIKADGGKAIAIQADVTRKSDVERLVEQTTAAFGRLDVLVNNAGAYPLSSLLEMREGEWDEVINANLRSVFLCTQAAAKQMIAQG